MSAEAEADKPQILVVDDSKVIRRAAGKMLGDGYIVHEAQHGVDAWQQLQQNDTISVVFTDIQMPEMNGMELLALIRDADDERIASLPVIMITGHSDTEKAKQTVFEAGATDFISKPFDSIDLLSRAKSYARLNRKVVELEKKTGHDKLTGLHSASSFEEQGAKAVSFANRHRLTLTTVHFEIIGFQDIYLSYGKSVAQQILVAVSKRLQDNLRAEDTAARIGVARFSILMPMTSETKAQTVIGRIRESINKLVFSTGRDRIRVVLAAGYSTLDVHNPGQTEFSDILAQCESALASALQSSQGNKVSGFLPQAEESAETAAEVSEDDMRAAFEQILNGEYYRIPEHVAAEAIERINRFLDYASSRQDTGQTATDAALDA